MSICIPATAEFCWMFPAGASAYRPRHLLERRDHFASAFRSERSTKSKLRASYSGSMEQGKEEACDLLTCPNKYAISSEFGSVNLDRPRPLSPTAHQLPQRESNLRDTESAI